ncbi:MAG: HNH endonuclease [Cyanobacteria bacterium J06632_19]
MSRQDANVLIRKAFPDVSFSESSYIKIQGARSPFDGDLVYWSKRNSKMYDGYTAKALVKQNHSCGMCGLAFSSDEKVELHHIDGKHDNNKQKNLVAVHQSCHQYHHMSKDLS